MSSKVTDQSQSEANEGFQHILPDNCVEYFLFLNDSEPDVKKQVFELDAVRKFALHTCRQLTKDYIWQRDEFNLESKNEKGLAYLHGLSDFGDSIEDEWLIVHLLRELSLSCPDVWIRVCDNDGEFLLVEAANIIPKWLNPEIDRNRVWINHGQLYIIPRKAEDMYKSPSITISDALDFIKTCSKDLVHSELIQSEAFYRLEKYPGQVTESLHHSVITIPRALVYILHEMPKSVAPAVEAFYLRDAISLKPIVNSSEELIFPPSDLVTASVRFSRVLYAQLKSQRFETPAQWRKSLTQASDPIARSRLEVGMMLTCGFEMLARIANKSNNKIVREISLLLSDIEEDGPEALPSDQQISSWKDADRDDEETWMDINYADFERELQGRTSTGRGNSGFGSAQTQADLRKIVQRFEAFMNDEAAGLDGAELEEMDQDDEDEGDSSGETYEDSDEEDKDISFDEEEFSKMMREMMGMPPVTDMKGMGATSGQTQRTNADRDDGDDEVNVIQELTAQFETELKHHGALKPDQPGGKVSRLSGPSLEQRNDRGTEQEEGEEESEGDGEIDIDYNLAKNLLESFKSQAGMSGPTGNLLGLMGFQLPRDEDTSSLDIDCSSSGQ